MNELKLLNLKDIEPEKVEWLWYPYIPLGKITLVRGDPGDGKTMFILNIIAALSQGKKFFGEGNESLNSLYQTAEDGLGDTVKPRLMAADASCEHVYNIDESDDLLSFTDERIEEAIKETGAKLLVLDPLQAYIGENVDMNRANEVRPAFRTLANVASRTQCAIVIIEHLNKVGDKKSLLRGLGSIDITGAARSILLICRPEENGNDVYMAHVKSNLAEKGATLRFAIENGRMVFKETSALTANELLNGTASFDSHRTKVQQVIEILQVALAEGEVPAQEVYDFFKDAGISNRTVENAKRELGIKSVKRGDRWYWTEKEERNNS